MTRITPRFIPQVVISRPLKPEKSARYYDWMVDQLRGAGAVSPGLVSGVRFVNLKEEPQDFDGFPGLPSKVKGAALTLGYKIEWVAKNEYAWHWQPSPQETEWRDLDKAAFLSRIQEIDVLLAGASDEEKADLEQEKKEAQSILSQLNAGGKGYLRSAPGAMQTKATGIFWGLAAPNVPVSLKSVFTLERDRAFSFAFKRQAAPKEQAQFRYLIGFGNGFTQYALSIGDDSNTTEFWHYRNMSPQKRAPLLAQLETVLDFGRLTVADRAQILEWEKQERIIRAKAKKDGEKLTPEQSQSIELLQKQVTDVKDSKRLTQEQEDLRQNLQNQIFLAQETFKLQEESSDLVNKRVDVTIQFLQSGYVIVRSGRTEFVYENKRVTGLANSPFHFSLPEKSSLFIQSDGGKWSFVFGHPKWNEAGTIRSQPFESLEVLNPSDFQDWLHGALLSGSQVENGQVWNYGTSATATLIELTAPSGIQAGKYQLEISLASDGRYTPELYYVGLYRPASVVVGENTALWSSGSNLSNGVSRILDVLLQSSERRARIADVVIFNGEGNANLPPHCKALACDVMLRDRQTDEVLTFQKSGFVIQEQSNRIGRIQSASGLIVIPLWGNETVLKVAGCEGFLNRKIDALVPADGMFPNDYVRQCCQDAGVPIALWSRIPSGNAGYGRIAPTKPGRYPHSKPAQGSTYLKRVIDVISDHCKGADLWSDAQGLRLDKFSVRDRPELNYGTPETGVDVESPLCLRGQLESYEDLEGYQTSATVIGAKNPLTGQRYSSTVSIPQATNEVFEDSPYFIGYEIPFVADANESLMSDAACALAARDQLKKTPETPNGLAPVFSRMSVDFDPTLLTNDLIRLFGIKFLLSSIEFSAFNTTSAGEDAGKLKLVGQLAE